MAEMDCVVLWLIFVPIEAKVRQFRLVSLTSDVGQPRLISCNRGGRVEQARRGSGGEVPSPVLTSLNSLETSSLDACLSGESGVRRPSWVAGPSEAAHAVPFQHKCETVKHLVFR
jgi:hypothetical protein